MLRGATLPLASAALPDRERANPTLRWLMHLGAPVAISVVVHVLLIGTMALKTWQVLTQASIDVGDYEAGVVQAPDDRMGGAFKWPGEDLSVTPEPDKTAAVDSLTDLRALSDLTPPDAAPSDQPGEGGAFGLGEGSRGGILGIGGGAGEAGTGGMGSGLGGRQLGEAGVWGVRGAANKVVYVIDYSGSIIPVVDALKRELKRSVGALQPRQSFDVILFYSSGAGEHERFKTESFEAALQSAQPDIRQRFFDWIDKKAPMGSTEPLAAVKRALALRPDAIFFFSDGLFEDGVVTQIAQANKDKVKVSCLLFDELVIGDDSGLPPKVQEQAQRLQKIADQNGGKMKVITAKDLQ